MNLISLAEQLSGNEEVAVHFDARRCLHHGDKFSGCDACYDVCPEEAIQPGRPPTVNRDTCRFCRACLPACPLGAYTMEDELPDLWRCAARLEQSAFEIICQHHPRPQYGPAPAAIRIRGCLAGLGAAAYVQLSTLPADHIIIRTDACEGCPWSQLTGQIARQLDQAGRFLLARPHRPVLETYDVGGDGNGSRRPVYSAHSPPVSRRDLFRFRSAPEPEAQALADGHHPFRERLRLLAALPALQDYDADTAADTPLPGPGFAALSVSGACSACGTCARACPSGALQLHLDETAQRFTLVFSLQACLGCQVCAHVCPENAIDLHPPPSVAAFVAAPAATTMRCGPIQRCDRCNVWFAPSEEEDRLCSVCAFRRRNPFGSRLPARFARSAPSAPDRSQQTATLSGESQ